MTQLLERQPHHDIHPLFFQRWSPRSYSGADIPDQVLRILFEAARWAPSSSNEQPWRFIFAKRGSVEWPVFFELLNDGNRRWAENASALVVLISKKSKIGRDGVTVVSKSHSFDTGAAWQNLALQAHLLGWGTRAIGGYDRDKARIVLGVPEDFALEAAVAIGKPAGKAALPPDLQEREVPTSRLPIAEFVWEGRFRASK
jgi:nitroreductase